MAELELALQVSQLRKAYGSVVAVDGLDLSIVVGECFGLLGPNGAGKTTTIEICIGLNTPDSGDVRVLGRSWESDAKWLRTKLGIQLQETQLTDKLSVLETLQLFRSFYPRGRSVDEVIDLVQLGEKRTARVGGLSGGQKQRLALACALVGDPSLLLLDEPTTGLDPQSRRQLWALVDQLKADGKTILLTTHYMDEAEQLCDRIAIVDHGRMIALGTPRELIASLGAEHVIRVGNPPDHTGLHGGNGAHHASLAVVSGVANGTPGIQLEELLSLPDVIGGREVASGFELRVAAVQRALPALLALAESRSIAWSEISTHSATLEDVFVALTGRELRDS